MDDDTRRIHRLLADGKLSGPDSDEILERLLTALERQRRDGRQKPSPLRALPYWGGAALATAATVLLVVSLPRTPVEDGGVVYEEGEMSSDVQLRVRCAPGELMACPVTSELVFASSGEQPAGVLSAYAERVGSQGAAEPERVVVSHGRTEAQRASSACRRCSRIARSDVKS